MRRTNGADGAQELVVDGSGIIEDASNDALDAFDSFCIKWFTGVNIVGFKLGCRTINDRPMLVWGVLWFGWVWMSISKSELCDVAIHSSATGALNVVPF